MFTSHGDYCFKFEMICSVARCVDNSHDVWSDLRKNWNHFYWLTGETPVSMDILLQGLTDSYFRNHENRNNSLNLRNQILLVLMWLRRYPTMQHLSVHFGVSVSTIHEIIHKMLPYFHEYLVDRYIKWHTMNKWRRLVGTFPDWPNCVAILDGTCFRISKPSGMEMK